MKAVILAGGLGSRLSEETTLRPKPLVEIGSRPILWHIMMIYSAHGINDFIICCGYKGHMIKEYFANYHLHASDVTFDMVHNRVELHQNKAEPWRVTVVDTGYDTQTGGRLKRVRHFIGEEDFCFTYGDGLGDVNIRASIEFHRGHGQLATVTAVRPPGRFGVLSVTGTVVERFEEKPLGDGGWINGGFFVLSPGVFDFIEGDHTAWEHEPLQRMAREGLLRAHLHDGFWHPMDTLRDVRTLQQLWNSQHAPWKVWE